MFLPPSAWAIGAEERGRALGKSLEESLRVLFESYLNMACPQEEESMLYEVVLLEKVKDKPDEVLNDGGQPITISAGSEVEAGFKVGQKYPSLTPKDGGKIEILIRPFSR